MISLLHGMGALPQQQLVLLLPFRLPAQQRAAVPELRLKQAGSSL